MDYHLKNKKESEKNENTFMNKAFKFVFYGTVTLASSYLCIKGLMFLRRRNPNIFIIKRQIGGELGKYYSGGFNKKMTKREACLILSVTDSITKQELREAHKKLMILNHPDNGGSTYIASKINQAKELLMLYAKENKI